MVVLFVVCRSVVHLAVPVVPASIIAVNIDVLAVLAEERRPVEVVGFKLERSTDGLCHRLEFLADDGDEVFSEEVRVGSLIRALYEMR